MKGLDFRDWEKIASDKKSTTLEHKNGHVMTIAHSMLPRIQQEQLQRLKMAQGGKVPEHRKNWTETGDEKGINRGGNLGKGISAAGSHLRGRPSAEPQSKQENEEDAKTVHSRTLGEMKEMKGQDRRYLESGGAIKGVHQSDEEDDGYSPAGAYARADKKTKDPLWQKSAVQEHKRVLGEMKDMRGDREYLADGTPPDSVPDSSQDTANDATDDAAAKVPAATPPPTNIINVNPPAATAAPTAPALPQAPAAQVQPIHTPPASNLNPVQQNAANTINAGQGLKDANLGQVPIAQAQAAITAPAEHELSEIQQTQADHANNAYQELRGHAQDFDTYQKQHPVNPNAYLENMGAGQKMAKAVGLFLGGFSSPFTGQANPALDMLNQQINRNVQAQQQNFDNRKTIWGAYKDLYGNANVATNMATAAENSRVGHLANMKAAGLQSPIALRQAQTLNNNIQLQNNDLFMKSAGILGQQRSGAGAPGARPKQPGQPTNPGTPNYEDQNLRPGSANAPVLPAAPQIKVDMNRIKDSQYLGGQGVPGELLPGEVGDANAASDKANTINQAVNAITKHMTTMWQNGDAVDVASPALKGQHLWDFKLPDIAKMAPTEEERQKLQRYYAAASALKKQVGAALPNGGSAEVYDMLGDYLPNRDTDPDTFRMNVKNAQDIIRQSMPVSVLKKIHAASGLPQ